MEDSALTESRRILLAHSQADDYTTFHAKLQDEHYNLQTAHSTEDLLHKVKTWSPHLIILAENMSRIAPLDLIKRVQQTVAFGIESSKWDHIMTAIIVDNADSNYIAAMLESGADEVLLQPLDLTLTKARIRSLIRQRDLHDQIKRHNQKLQVLNIRDELTGLFKMHHVQERLSEEVQRSRRNNSSLSCIIMDIDGMRRVIDQFDHSVASTVIAEIGQVLRESTRHIDVTGHHGGDEFILILPDAAVEAAKLVAERILANIARRKFSEGRKKIKLTACFGISTIDHVFQDEGSSLLRRAERALAEAKKNGPGSIAIDQ
jgi:two-component system cell cycle response regulator